MRNTDGENWAHCGSAHDSDFRNVTNSMSYRGYKFNLFFLCKGKFLTKRKILFNDIQKDLLVQEYICVLKTANKFSHVTQNDWYQFLYKSIGTKWYY